MEPENAVQIEDLREETITIHGEISVDEDTNFGALIEEECTCSNGVREGIIDGNICDACRRQLEDKEIPY